MCFSSGSGSDVSNISQRQRILCVILNTNIPYTEQKILHTRICWNIFHFQFCEVTTVIRPAFAFPHFNVYFPLAPSQPLPSPTIICFLQFEICHLMLSLEVFIPFIVTLAHSWVSRYNADYGNINYSPLPLLQRQLLSQYPERV